jgi:hypothetical protein
MPPDDVTRWLAVDRERQLIQIEPGVAVPDLDHNSRAKLTRAQI